MKSLILIAGAATIALGTIALGTMALAQDDDVDPAVTARQAHMQLYSHNLGILGGMAQEKIPYDADLAGIAAANLAAIAALDETTYWPEGTAEGTKALPAIWENMDDFSAKQDGMTTAAAAMADVASTDLASLQGAIRDLGGACTACHREYRERDE